MMWLWYDVMGAVLAVGLVLAVGMALAVCMVAYWRQGVRDGMRMQRGEAPEPMRRLAPQAAPVEPEEGSEEKLQAQLAEIDAYDGWKK